MNLSKSNNLAYKFKPIKIAEETIKTIILAGMVTPLNQNPLPLRFIVVDDAKVLDAMPKFHRYIVPLLTAKQIIVVCADTRGLDLDKNLILGCSASAKSMLYEIEKQGLGGVLVGVYPKADRMKEITALLHLPKNIKVYSIVCFGIIDVKKPYQKYFKEFVHLNRWNKEQAL